MGEWKGGKNQSRKFEKTLKNRCIPDDRISEGGKEQSTRSRGRHDTDVAQQTNTINACGKDEYENRSIKKRRSCNRSNC